jgi:NADPH:quinone reductase
MRAVGFTEPGAPEVLHFVELPEPQAGPGEIRIRVHAATVNPTDTGPRSGNRPEALQGIDPPYVPGMDAAGIVDQIGPDTDTDLRVGDRVMAIVIPSGSHGAYSEQIVLPAGSVVRSPAGASDAEASTLPMNGLTARLSLDLLVLKPGQTVAVTGAAGAVGGYVIELAKADGLHVIADAAPKDEELVRSFGADVVIPRGDDFAQRVREAVPEGVDAVVDSALLNELVAPAVKDGGRISTLRRFVGPEERGITYYPVSVRVLAEDNAALDRLREQVEKGEVKLRVARVLPAAEAPEAHRLLQAGGVRGRIVLEF